MTKPKEANANEGVATEPSLQKKNGSGAAPAKREPIFPSIWAENPFVFMRRFAEDMEKFFEDFGSFRIKPLFRGELLPRMSEFGRAVWAPEIEIFERDGQFIVRADLPGLKKDDLHVEITDNALTLSGERKLQKEEEAEGYYRSERAYGSFFRQIPLPEGVKADDATATFKDGVLEVALQAPHRAVRGRKLEINEATGDTAKAEAKSAST